MACFNIEYLACKACYILRMSTVRFAHHNAHAFKTFSAPGKPEVHHKIKGLKVEKVSYCIEIQQL